MKNQIVHVIWVDSSTACGWQHGAVHNELTAIHSIGFVAAMDKKALTLTSTMSHGGKSCLDPVTIPQGSILRVTKIQLKGKSFTLDKED